MVAVKILEVIFYFQQLQAVSAPNYSTNVKYLAEEHSTVQHVKKFPAFYGTRLYSALLTEIVTGPAISQINPVHILTCQ